MPIRACSRKDNMALLSSYTTYWIYKMMTAKPQCYLQCFVVVCCTVQCPHGQYQNQSQIVHQWPQFVGQRTSTIHHQSKLFYVKRKKIIKMKKWITRPHTNDHNKNSQKRKVATKRLLSDQLPTRLIRKKSFISKMRWSIWSFNNCPPWISMSKTNRKFMIDRFFCFVPCRQGKYVWQLRH